MANVHAIYSVGDSLETFLNNAYPESLRAEIPCTVRLLSSQGMAEADDLGNTLSIYLYRVGVNQHLRNARRVADPAGSRAPLSLDLHYLISVWAQAVVDEHVILAWAARHLHEHPVLDQSSLTPAGGWDAGDYVQVVPEELSNEDVLRIWDGLDMGYRVSVPYVARVVRIGGEAAPGLPAVATRFSFGDRELEEELP